MEIGKRIKSLRLSKNMTLEEIGAYVGVSKTTIQRWESGEIRNMRRDKIAKLAEVLGTTPGELIGWEPEKTAPPSESETLNLPDVFPIRKKSFPLLGEIACGEPTYEEEERETMGESTEGIDADFCLRARGDSMTGAQIDDGDVVFIKQMPMVDNGDIAAVVIENETTLKRVDYDPDRAELILWPENPAYRPQIYRGEELNTVRILGRAVVIQKRIRRK